MNERFQLHFSSRKSPTLVRTVLEAGGDVQYISEFKHSLEDVYLSLINNK